MGLPGYKKIHENDINYKHSKQAGSKKIIIHTFTFLRICMEHLSFDDTDISGPSYKCQYKWYRN
jgi:hypothetical protein